MADKTVEQLTAEAIGALARCQRGAALYEFGHPAARQQRREALDAILAWQQATGGSTVVAAGGDRAFATGNEEGLADELGAGLAEAMITRNIVGLALASPLPAHDMDQLAMVLGEAPRRLRAAGGAATELARQGAGAIVVTPIDLDTILAGAAVDETGMHPLVARGVRSVLVIRGNRERRGAVVELRLKDVTSATSLGSMLDDLIDGAAPGVAARPPPPPPAGAPPNPLAGANAEEIAALCSKSWTSLTTRMNRPEVLAQAAHVMAGALQKLAPDARFKLLRRLAEVSNQAGADALGKAVPNPVVLSAIAEVVRGGARSTGLARAISEVLEQLRPLEQDRQRLIGEIEEDAQRWGRPLDGLFLEQLRERARTERMAATLELPFRDTRDSLTRTALARRAAPDTQPEVINRTFSSLLPEHRFARSTRLLRGMLEHEREVAPQTLSSVRALLANSAQDPAMAAAGGELIGALWDRVLQDGPRSAAAQQLLDVMGSPTGPDWCVALLRLLGARGDAPGALLVDVLRRVLEAHPGDAFARRLADVLASLQRGVLREIERRILELPPAGVTVLISCAGRESPSAALSLAQNALRATTTEAKATVLRTLAQLPDPVVLAFLRKVVGLEGDAPSAAALFLKASDAALPELQKVAVEVLGASRAPGAVPILVETLSRIRTGAVASQDPLVALAGRALVINNTREARAAVEEGKRSKNRAVRVACGGAP